MREWQDRLLSDDPGERAAAAEVLVKGGEHSLPLLRRLLRTSDERLHWEAIEIVHRIGPLSISEPIVFVGVSSPHRQAAFEACAFIMDYLKTSAPFWKREDGASGTHWVDARDSDRSAVERWADTQPHAAMQRAPA